MEIKVNGVYSNNLKNININLYENQITSFIGSNDSGKTELLNLISGLNLIEKGTIEYGDKKLDSKSIKNIIYYLKEDYSEMLFNININEDIKFYLGNFNKEKLYELLKKFNLDIEILNKNYLELSSSEVRKILLIIGLMSEKQIIILENANLKLDTKSKQTLIKELKRLKRNNKIIIVTSYDTDFLLEVSDKILVMEKYKILKEDNKFEILSNKKLLKKINLKIPNTLNFINEVKEIKNIKIGYRDNINDLLKDIYRYAK